LKRGDLKAKVSEQWGISDMLPKLLLAGEERAKGVGRKPFLG